jgi:hypothetical protein
VFASYGQPAGFRGGAIIEAKAKRIQAARPAGQAEPWRTAGEAVVVLRQPVVLRRTVRIALLVGTILSAINQGGVILGGHATLVLWLRVVANYLIPFGVSNAGVLSATRVPDEPPAGTGPLDGPEPQDR